MSFQPYQKHVPQVFVVGFLFDISRTRVVLLEKQKPDYMKGKLCGPGGKVETGEWPIDAMIREFAEETGVRVDAWHPFAVLHCSRPNILYEVIHFFWARTEFKPHADRPTNLDFLDRHMETDERLYDCGTGYGLAQIPHEVYPNLRWLIPMAVGLSLNQERAASFEIFEVYE